MAKAAADSFATFPRRNTIARAAKFPLSSASLPGALPGMPITLPWRNFHAIMAAREAVHLLAHRTHATGGLILLDREGHPGFAFNTPRMAYGYVALDGAFVIAVSSLLLL